MIIEVRKAGFINKGAELMLRAVHRKLSEIYPHAVFTMVPTRPSGSVPFRKLVDSGFYPKLALHRYGVQWARPAYMIPNSVRQRFGLIVDREVDVVFDIAGFAYSDQWGVRTTRELAQSVRRWRRRGTKVILMPQAFGPFTGRSIRRYIRTVVDCANLVMARDRRSYEHLVDAVGERQNIVQFPDFTNLIEGVIPTIFDPRSHHVCIVPNYRMIDKTDATSGKNYLLFMQRCAKYLLEQNGNPFLLVHERARDMWLAEQIAGAAGDIPVICLEDPLEIKGILGASRATIGCRFHGLVSALSEGVPSLGTAWSHKYAELFNEYGFPEGLLSVNGELSQRALGERIEALMDPDRHKVIRSILLERSQQLKRQSEEMWATVFRLLDRAKISNS